MAKRYDERFDELTGLVYKVVGRVDEIQLDMRDMRKEVREVRSETVAMRSELNEHGSRFDKLEVALQVASGKQNDVISKVIGIQKTVNRISETQSEQTFKMLELINRLDGVDRRLETLDERTEQMDSEVKEIRKSLDSFVDPILDGKTVWANIRHVEERIARLEEKLPS